MALQSDIVPMRGAERLGERGNRAAMVVQGRFGKKRSCPSWTGKGDGEQDSRAERRERGQNEGRCVYVGEDGNVSVEQEGIRAGSQGGQTEEGIREERCV